MQICIYIYIYIYRCINTHELVTKAIPILPKRLTRSPRGATDFSIALYGEPFNQHSVFHALFPRVENKIREYLFMFVYIYIYIYIIRPQDH